MQRTKDSRKATPLVAEAHQGVQIKFDREIVTLLYIKQVQSKEEGGWVLESTKLQYRLKDKGLQELEATHLVQG